MSSGVNTKKILEMLELLPDGYQMDITKIENGKFHLSITPAVQPKSADIIIENPQQHFDIFAQRFGKEYLTFNRATKLDAMMRQVRICKDCGKGATEIPPAKQLVNFIAERSDGPRYGKVPTMWTDWASRLDARIMVVGQDWGTWQDAKALRQEFEANVGTLDSGSKVWRRMIGTYNTTDNSSRNLIKFLRESATLEGLSLPTGFVDDIFVTNAVLCVRKGMECSGYNNFDAPTSTTLCTRFLRWQLEIVRPVVIVALGDWAWFGLSQIWDPRHAFRVVSDRSATSDEADLPLAIVRVSHPAARIKRDRQVESYRPIWRTLAQILKLSGEQLVVACFPSARDALEKPKR